MPRWCRWLAIYTFVHWALMFLLWGIGVLGPLEPVSKIEITMDERGNPVRVR